MRFSPVGEFLHNRALHSPIFLDIAFNLLKLCTDFLQELRVNTQLFIETKELQRLLIYLFFHPLQGLGRIPGHHLFCVCTDNGTPIARR
jgi:hypothetical protein